MSRLWEHVDAAPLRLFCITLGGCVIFRTVHIWPHMEFLETSALLFPYAGLEWLPRPPGSSYHALLAGSLLGALGMIIRPALQRPMAILSAVCFGWLFFLDQSFYGHLSYLLCWLLGVACLSPGNLTPSARVPRWLTWMPRFILVLMYLCASLAKLYPEWLDGSVIELFMREAQMSPETFATLSQPWLTRSLAVAGVVFDFAIGPLLLWRRSRPLAFVAMALFHLSNMILVGIHVLPLIIFVLTVTAFLDPDRARAALRWEQEPLAPLPHQPPAMPVRALLLGFLLLHLGLAARPYLYERNSRWTHKAQHFAWWLRSTDTDTRATFTVISDTAGTQKIKPLDYISMEQASMTSYPQHVIRFARHVAAQHEARGEQRVRVHADIITSVNGRAPSRRMPHELDLAHLPAGTDPFELLLDEGEQPSTRQ